VDDWGSRHVGQSVMSEITGEIFIRMYRKRTDSLSFPHYFTPHFMKLPNGIFVKNYCQLI
jgi:hypothetical protein